MSSNIKLLTQEFCEELLTFPKRPERREMYNKDAFDLSDFKYVKTPTSYVIEEGIILGSSPKDDCESSIALFQQLMHLDRVQANDKRLWVSLTHNNFFDYTKKRWNISALSSDGTIISRFHFEGVGVEARMRNSIARLWWTAKLTHDPKKEDPFELTKLIWERQDIHVALMERSFGTYPNFLEHFLEFYKLNKHLTEDNFRLILRGINSIGGVKMIPLLNGREIGDEIRKVAAFAKIEVN